MSAGPAFQRRFPFSALVVATGGLSVTELAQRAGVSRRGMTRYVTAGVPERTADAIAVALGLHPGEVWAEWFEAAS